MKNDYPLRTRMTRCGPPDIPWASIGESVQFIRNPSLAPLAALVIRVYPDGETIDLIVFDYDTSSRTERNVKALFEHNDYETGWRHPSCRWTGP